MGKFRLFLTVLGILAIIGLTVNSALAFHWNFFPARTVVVKSEPVVVVVGGDVTIVDSDSTRSFVVADKSKSKAVKKIDRAEIKRFKNTNSAEVIVIDDF